MDTRSKGAKPSPSPIPKRKNDGDGKGGDNELEMMEVQERASLVDSTGIPTGEPSMTTTTLQLVAPATLKEGYVIETRLGGSGRGRIVEVTVVSE
jgi:hypothetical protein